MGRAGTSDLHITERSKGHLHRPPHGFQTLLQFLSLHRCIGESPKFSLCQGHITRSSARRCQYLPYLGACVGGAADDPRQGWTKKLTIGSLHLYLVQVSTMLREETTQPVQLGQHQFQLDLCRGDIIEEVVDEAGGRVYLAQGSGGRRC